MNLDEIREKIEEIDKEIIQVLSKRIKLIPKAIEYKRKNNIEMLQPERESQVIKTRRELGEKLGLDPDFIEDLFKRIIQESHNLEKKY